MKKLAAVVCCAFLTGSAALAADVGGALKSVAGSDLGKAATSAVTDKAVGELTKKLNKVQNKKGLIKFVEGKADVDPACDTTLAALAELIKQAGGFRVQVDCHTDNEGVAADNLKLSQDRADAVVKYLVEKKAVDAKQLAAKGWGDTKPVGDNKTEGGRKKNRRVDFSVTKL